MAVPETFSKHSWTSIPKSTPKPAPKQDKKQDQWRGVILRDFDADTQRRIQFHPAVCASFFDNLYTDENDAELLWLSSPGTELKKRQQVKYGNNIAVLFKALYQFRDFYTWKSFWPAIAKGWKANAGCIEVIASILVQARRKYRQGPGGGRPACQTAQAADLWIDFLDYKGPSNAQPDYNWNNLIPAVKEFYLTMERKMVNAGRVSRDSTQSSPPLSLPRKPLVTVGGPIKPEGQASDHNDDRKSLGELKILGLSTRKRSRSPCSSESPTPKRPNRGVTDGPGGQEAPCGVPPQQDRDTQSLPPNRQASPPVSSREPVLSDDTPKLKDNRDEDIPKPQENCDNTKPSETSPKPTDGCSTDSQDPLVVPESRTADVERLATAGAMVHLQRANEDIKENISSLRSNLESLTDSMALIVDHVESVRHDVNELKKQQQQEQQQDLSPPTQDLSILETLLQKCATEVATLKTDLVGLKIVSDAREKKHDESQTLLKSTAASSLELMQEMTSYMQTMMSNLSALKSQPQPAPAPVQAPPVQLHDIKTLMEGPLADHESKITSQVESLLAQREDRIKRHMENVLSKQQESIASQIEDMLAKQLARVPASIEERITARKNELRSRTPVNTIQPSIDKRVDEQKEKLQSQIEELLTLAQQGSKMQAKLDDFLAHQSKVGDSISQHEAKLEKILSRQSGMEESISEYESKTQSKMAIHFREQSGSMDKLRDELSSIKSDVALLATGAKAANPLTMREAMQFAVIDMKQHQEKVQRFYNRLTLMDGLNTTAQLADFLVKLDDTLMSARACGITTPGSR